MKINDGKRMNAETVKVGCFQMLLVLIFCINYIIVSMNHALPAFHNYTPKFYCQVIIIICLLYIILYFEFFFLFKYAIRRTQKMFTRLDPSRVVCYIETARTTH